MTKTIIDDDIYDDFQSAFLNQMILSIKRAVETHIVDVKLSQKIVADVTFAVCCDIDGSSIMKFNEKELVPSLCFEEDDNKLVTGPSWMHEYACGAVDAVY
ncbi:MAG: hypothetical protein KGO49_00120 [Gammaproteobacteria bacterium]|nr:hypothetical protein [Gammaproteobacteria bacterium]